MEEERVAHEVELHPVDLEAGGDVGDDSHPPSPDLGMGVVEQVGGERAARPVLPDAVLRMAAPELRGEGAGLCSALMVPQLVGMGHAEVGRSRRGLVRRRREGEVAVVHAQRCVQMHPVPVAAPAHQRQRLLARGAQAAQRRVRHPLLHGGEYLLPGIQVLGHVRAVPEAGVTHAPAQQVRAGHAVYRGAQELLCAQRHLPVLPQRCAVVIHGHAIAAPDPIHGVFSHAGLSRRRTGPLRCSAPYLPDRPSSRR